jgi:hypothetical protein
MDKKEYSKKYWSRPEVKAKKQKEQKEAYGTEKNQKYEHGRRRTPNSRYLRSKYNASKRGKTFTLTLEEYTSFISLPCYYCQTSIAEETGSSLDRKNNERGYEIDNVVTCCRYCNRRRAKSMSSEVFHEQFQLNLNKKV